jgi:hypothetical protein
MMTKILDETSSKEVSPNPVGPIFMFFTASSTG